MSVEKTCIITGKKFVITDKEEEIRLAASPVIGGKLYPIDEPNHHPDIDRQRHLVRRNERTLYRATCDLTGKPMITSINPKQGYIIYNFYERWSDKWDPMEYGVEVSFDKTFTEQYSALYKSMPQISLNLSLDMENCDYCNYGYEAKDCYMCTTAAWSENCYYSCLPLKCIYDVDGYANTGCQWTYGCVYSKGCFECQYCFYTDMTKYSAYLLDCVNCDYCFGCVNLSGKQYCIFNEQYEEEEYQKEVDRLFSEFSRDELLEKFYTFSLQYPRRATRGTGNENVEGDLLFNTSNIINSFDMQECSDCVECWVGGIQTSDIARSTLSGMTTRTYSITGGVSLDASAFNIGTIIGHQIYYSYYCRDCNYCFGCVRLEHKEYCIFNKQYTKEEYEELLPKLIAHMQTTGEWSLPLNPSICQFPYNDTCAQEWFPLDKKGVEEKGWLWIDQEITTSTKDSYVPKDPSWYNTPEKVKELTSAIIVCPITKRPFKIIEQELPIYQKLGIPLPTKHHEQRYQEQIALRQEKRVLYDSVCDKTGVIIKTIYSPKDKEIVWSNEVWDQEFRG